MNNDAHDCTEGDVNIFFKNTSKRTVRSDWYYCPLCYPESRGGVTGREGEVEIDVQDFNILTNQGYRDVSD